MKSYEQVGEIYFAIVCLFIIEILGIIKIYHQKQFNYHLLRGIVIKKDYLVLMIDQKERDNLYHNNSLYLKGFKKKYKIIEDHGKLLKKNKKNYYEVIIKTNFSKKYKPNDMIELSLAEKKQREIELFKIIWGGA